MGALQIIGYAVMISFLVWGLGATVWNMSGSDFEQLKANATQTPGKTTAGLVMYSYGLNSLAPAWEPEFLGRKWFVPYPDSTDLIFLIPLVLIIIWIIRNVDFFQSSAGFLWAALFLVLTTGVLWIIWKIIVYYLFLMWGGHNIGLNTEQIQQTLRSLLDSSAAYRGKLVFITLINSFSILAGTISSRKQ